MSGGTSIDGDGKVRAWQSVSCTVPAANWQKITFQLTDTTTNEIYQAQAAISGTTASATMSNLPPGRAMQLRAWATNSNNVDGAVAGPVSFTSATSTAVPSAPGSATVSQTHSKQIDYEWPVVTPAAGAAPIVAYIAEQSQNSGAFVEIFRGLDVKTSNKQALTGSTYQFRVKARDSVGNESSYTTSGTITAAKMIDDTHVVVGGINGPSIGNGSIGQAKANTGTGSFSGTLASNTQFVFVLQKYLFHPNFRVSGAGGVVQITADTLSTGGVDDTGTFGVFNSGPNTGTTSGAYRYMVP